MSKLGVKNLVQNLGPSKWQWYGAIFCFWLVIYLINCGDSLVETYRIGIVQKHIQDEVLVSHDPLKLLENREIKEWVDPERLKKVKKVIQTTLMLNNENYEKLFLTIRAKNFPKIDEKRKLLKLAELLNREIVKLEDSRLELEGLKSKQESLKQKYELITSDLLLIFNEDVVSQAPHPQWESENLNLYQYGIFKSLPVLTGLPDNIETSKSLKPYLSGSYVRATEKHLEKLRKRTENLNREINKFQFNSAKINRTHKENSENINLLRQEAKVRLQREVLKLTLPSTDESTISLYENFSTFAKGLGFDMPRVIFSSTS